MGKKTIFTGVIGAGAMAASTDMGQEIVLGVAEGIAEVAEGVTRGVGAIEMDPLTALKCSALGVASLADNPLAFYAGIDKKSGWLSDPLRNLMKLTPGTEGSDACKAGKTVGSAAATLAGGIGAAAIGRVALKSTVKALGRESIELPAAKTKMGQMFRNVAATSAGIATPVTIASVLEETPTAHGPTLEPGP